MSLCVCISILPNRIKFGLTWKLVSRWQHSVYEIVFYILLHISRFSAYSWITGIIDPILRRRELENRVTIHVIRRLKRCLEERLKTVWFFQVIFTADFSDRNCTRTRLCTRAQSDLRKYIFLHGCGLGVSVFLSRV